MPRVSRLRLWLGNIGVAAVLLCAAACGVRTPGSIETRLIEGTKRRITVGGRSDVNPLAVTQDNIHAGQRNFASYCMICHGLDGQNTGVPFADKMSPPVPVLRSAAVQAYSDGQLHWIIKNGISPSGMPASRDIFHDEEIWQLVLYIRHLPPKGSLGEPPVYGGN
ncbi:MAG TPA: cytochrome c [Candidatus Sulfotelmatobacter sp.]|nr:cytochrome c [Candidatus Sulfotelmatobacter sp.]